MNRSCNEINGFSELLQRFERNISILGRSKRTFENYSRHVASMALHFGALPTELDPEQVKDYLFELQQRSESPSQSYFKHTVYGLRFLLKTENLSYDYLHLPSIPKEKKLPVILSRDEIWKLLQHADLLKHRILIGLIYSCGLRCMEVRNIELKHLDFDRKLLHIVQSKGKKDRYVPLSDHIIRGIKKYISAEHPTTFLFTGNSKDAKGFDSRYSQRGVQWAIQSVCKKAGILKIPAFNFHFVPSAAACILANSPPSAISSSYEPSSTHRPSFKTAILSAFLTVESLCAMINVVLP